MLTVMIADNHAAMRAAIGRLFQGERCIEVVGECGAGTDAVALAEAVRPDLAVLDFAMPGLNAVQAARRMERAAPRTRVIVVTGHDVSMILPVAATAAGVAAVIGKDKLSSQLVRTVRAVGRTHASPPPTHRPEPERLAALRTYGIMDTEPEPAYDDIVRAAARLTGCPIALMTLIDGDRQWFKARVGLDVAETPREQAFCHHTILDSAGSPLVVPDATRDARFAGNPLVIGPPAIRFYAGVALVNPDGAALGTLCVIDRKPRDMCASHQRLLTRLASMILVALEARRTASTSCQPH